MGGRFSALDLLDNNYDLDFLSSHVNEVLESSAEKVMERKKPTKVTVTTKKVLNFCKFCKRFKTKREPEMVSGGITVKCGKT